MNKQKLDEYLELCDKIASTESATVVHHLDPDFEAEEGEEFLPFNEVLESFKRYGITPVLDEENQITFPESWVVEVLGEDYRNSLAVKDKESLDAVKLLTDGFNKAVESVEEAIISANVGALLDIHEQEKTYDILRKMK
jgi:hypothetical protein